MAAKITINVRSVSGKVSRLVFDSDQTVGDLREAAASDASAASSSARAQLSLIHKGKVLSSDAAHLADIITDNDVVLVVPARRQPPAELRPAIGEIADDDEDDDLSLARPPPGASRLHRALGAWLKNTCRAPDAVLVWFYLIKPWVWLALLVWMVAAPIAARMGVGPLYVLCSVLVVMLCNLGTRKRGEVSAYSLFNENVRALPGQLDAEQVDRALVNRM